MPTRRDILSGRPKSPRTYLMEVGRRAMACQFAVYLNAGVDSQWVQYADEALDLVGSIEAQLTVYRPSEITNVNQKAFEQPVEVNRNVFGLLQQCVEIFHETNRAFDVTAGPLIDVWGFFRRDGRMPSEEMISEALSRVGSDGLRLDADQATVQFDRSGMQINLGAIGKGYALDRVARYLIDLDVTDFMLHGGNSSVLAMGSRAGRAAGGWAVGIRHPLRPDKRLAEVYLNDQAIGTSGTGTQHFYHGGKRYGHIIDPRTGRPAEGVFSVSVIAGSAALADALATAFYVSSVDQIRDYCQTHPDIGVLVTRTPESGAGIRLDDFNLEPEQWKMLV